LISVNYLVKISHEGFRKMASTPHTPHTSYQRVGTTMVKMRLLLTQEQAEHLTWEAHKRSTSISEVAREIFNNGIAASKKERHNNEPPKTDPRNK
jgi:hypothetical protein